MRWLVFILFLFGCTNNRAPSSEPPTSIEIDGCSVGRCRSGDDEILYQGGRSYALKPKAKPLSDISLAEPGFEIVEVVYLESNKDHLVLSYSLRGQSDDRTSRVRAYRRRDLKPAWTVKLPDVAFSKPPTLSGHMLYVGEADLIAKIDLSRGRFKWKHTSESLEFKSAPEITLKKGLAVFTADDVVLTVRDKSGKVVR